MDDKTAGGCEVNEHIKISNIYYMLAYAFQGLTAGIAAKYDSEEFENLHSLLAEIILRGLTRQIKRGIQRGYIPYTETLSGVRGKIDMSASIGQLSHLKRQLVCEYDEFSTDTPPNRIIKAAVTLLLRHGELSPEKKRGLKRLKEYLSTVKDLGLREVRFDVLKSARINSEYKLLLAVCKLLFDDLLMSESEGGNKLRSWLPDEKMHQLYERFVREYYRKHHPEFHASASQIEWDLTAPADTAFLPAMRSDTTLTCDNRTLIIDTKWYTRTMSAYFGKKAYHSGNLHQIYSYVNNTAKGQSGNVHGVLLYAKTDEVVAPDGDFTISGNGVSVKTLDLSQDFTGIQAQLEKVAGLLTLSV
jgi:5-methylcytosine-specific restriction enzyme subunit McrC